MIPSTSVGNREFKRKGEIGVWFRIASNTMAVVRPLKGRVPVPISYSITPKENRSLRRSNASPRACSGDM